MKINKLNTFKDKPLLSYENERQHNSSWKLIIK